MVPALTAPVLAAAVLLALAAPSKLRTPDLAARALAEARVPGGLSVRRAVVRALGVVEILLALAVLLVPSRAVLALLALAYAGFAAFVVVLIRRGAPLSSCGCFGRPDTPATVGHVVVVGLIAVVVALAAAWSGSASVPAVLAAGVRDGAVLLVLAGLTTALAWAALAVVPQVAAARSPLPQVVGS